MINNIHRIELKKSYLWSWMFLLVFCFQCQSTFEGRNRPAEWVNNIKTDESQDKHVKHKGAHVFRSDNKTDFKFLHQNNVEWVTLVAWGFQDNHDSPYLTHHNGDSLYIVRSDSVFVQRIHVLREAGFKVFIKPHIWVEARSDGEWRSDIFPSDDANWILWKNSYRDLIMRYAKIAQKGKAEMFCVGTELTRLSSEKPEFWRSLIKEVRGIYSGEITYAANWYREYEQIAFWDKLDYIGVQAYFPLVDHSLPTVNDISIGWNKHIPQLVAVHKKFKKKILFTEMGYKSTADSAIKPWQWYEEDTNQNLSLSLVTQANCYQAFFETVWDQDWFGGVHIWQMRDPDEGQVGGLDNLDFTPQGKPAEQIIAKGFAAE